MAKAAQLYGADEQRAVADAWHQVGIRVSGVLVRGFAGVGPPEGSLEALQGQIEKLASDVRMLIKEVRAETQTKSKATVGRGGSRQKIKTD